jgi:LPXTG-motif cell wall-anchored protein
MRRLVILLACVAAFVGVAAAPAFAQKDPFDPLITEEDTASQPDGDTAPIDTTDTDDTTTIEPQPGEDEPLPSTGGDPGRWIGLATLAISLGAGLLILVRAMDPPALRRVRGR